MNLIVITRIVNRDDSRAGFMVGWLNALSIHVSKLFVASWQGGSDAGLASNIYLTSLKGGKVKKMFQCVGFLIKHLSSTGGVLVLQNPEYAMLAGPITKLFRRKLISWYAHGAVTLRRRIMELFSHTILTSSESGFRKPLRPSKVSIIGQGIDITRFTPRQNNKTIPLIHLLTVGRVTPTKDIESMIQALAILKHTSSRSWHLSIIGTPATSVDTTYLDNLKALVHKQGLDNAVTFVGGVPWHTLPRYYALADIFLNLSGTGSLDKAVLEAMASGCLVITSNEAFESILPPTLTVLKNNPRALAEKILHVCALPNEQKRIMKNNLRDFVEKNHSLAVFAERMVQSFQ